MGIMYTRYFGFNEKPFSLTPNPRFIFLSKNHKEAFAHLLYGINSHYGFIALTGEVGTGKTTVLRTLLGQFQDENYRCALIFNPCLTAVELVRSINQEFGIQASSACVNDLLTALNQFLLAENNQGRTVVLVIDEAQNLLPEVLEQLRLISNLETESDKLIQIVLAGQPELETILRQRNLRQLNQRIAVRYKLKPMERNETGTYIGHRMHIAGNSSGVTFTNTAISLIHLYSHGIPRTINILCDRTLLIAYGDERRKVTFATAVKAITESLGIPIGRYVLAGLVAVILLGIVFNIQENARFYEWSQGLRFFAAVPPAPAPPSNTPHPPPPAHVTATPAPHHPQEILNLGQELLGHSLNDVHVQALNALFSKWESPPIRRFKGTLKSPVTFNQLAAKRNLRCTAFNGSLHDAIRFNIPFLMRTTISDRSGFFHVAVTTATPDSVSVSPPLLGNGLLSRHELAKLSDGTFYLLWRNSKRIPDSLRQGDRGLEVRYIQRILKQMGHYPGTISGDFNDATVKALNAFQQSRGIPVNNSMGELTLALLSISDVDIKSPALKGS